MLIAVDEPDGVHWRVGYNNFYVITRYNHSALYAMAVYDLAAAVRQQVLLDDAPHDAAAPARATPRQPCLTARRRLAVSLAAVGLALSGCLSTRARACAALRASSAGADAMPPPAARDIARRRAAL